MTRSIITTRLSTNDTNITDSKVKLNIDGTNDETYYIICSNDDECIVNCLSNTSCRMMDLICNGICNLNCGKYGDLTGNDCPSNIPGIWYPLKFIPTSYPTTVPGQYPTQFATSNSPTEQPSNITSCAFTTVVNLPTNIPSDFFNTTNAMSQTSSMTTGMLTTSSNSNSNYNFSSIYQYTSQEKPSTLTTRLIITYLNVDNF